MSSQKPELVFQGNGVSPGVVQGNALKLDSHKRVVLKIRIYKDLVDEEVNRLHKAVGLSKEQLKGLKARLEEKVGHEHSYILDAHMLMLEDRSLLAEIESNIRRMQVSAEWAVRRATDRIRRAYDSLEDDYFRERGRDIESVVERVLLNLSGEKHVSWAPLPDDLIIVARDFTPLTFGSIELEKISGMALEAGGRTSHTAIIARSLRIPAVMEAGGFLSHVTTGDTVLLDGDRGEIVLNPSPERLDRVRNRLQEFKATLDESQLLTVSPSVTQDGVTISLLANIELPHEVRSAKRCGAEGIGLFRSEFLFMAHPSGFPGMEEQQQTYELLATEMSPYPVAIRTLDVGADKDPTATGLSTGLNPSMGLRGIRLSLQNPDTLTTQLEAILRASARGRMEILFPMITMLEELRRAKSILRKVIERLKSTGVPMNDWIPVGIMIEVPAAVLMIEALAEEVDFFSIGTNDLVQYTLAVDRNDPVVSHLFQPLHPSVLRSLGRIAEVCRSRNKPARVCGEIAANPFLASLLIGFGFTELSVNAYSIPTIRKVVGALSLAAAQNLVSRVMTFMTAQEVADFLMATLPGLIKMDLTPFVKEIEISGTSLSISHVS